MTKIVLSLNSPVSANLYWRTRVAGKIAMTYVSSEAKAYKAHVLAVARAAGIVEPIKGRVQIEICMYPNRPQDWQKRMRQLGAAWDDGVRSIDLDNANKVLLDSLKGVVIEDDGWQVRRLTSERMEPDGAARVVVTITAMATAQPQMALV